MPRPINTASSVKIFSSNLDLGDKIKHSHDAGKGGRYGNVKLLARRPYLLLKSDIGTVNADADEAFIIKTT